MRLANPAAHAAGELIKAAPDQLDLAVLGQHGMVVAVLAFAARADQPGERLAIGILFDTESLGDVDRRAGGGPLLGFPANCPRKIAVGDQVDRPSASATDMAGKARRRNRAVRDIVDLPESAEVVVQSFLWRLYCATGVDHRM